MRKIVAFILVVLTSFGLCVGCSSQKPQGTTGSNGQIVVEVANLGFGIEWLNKLAESFTAETDIGVKIVSELGSAGVDAINTRLMSGKSEADIIFSKKGDFSRYVYMTSKQQFNNKVYDKLYVNINDVWDEIGDKVNPQYKDFFNYDDNYYAVPWAGGAFGLVRNKDAWEKLGYNESDIPLTTDELFELCDDISSKYATHQVYPFTFSAQSEYYSTFVNLYFAQYEGIETFNRFRDGKAPQDMDEDQIYTYQGQYETVEFFAKLLEMEKTAGGEYKFKYQDEYSVSQDFIDMQDSFISGYSVFCVNGSWLGVESGDDTANIDFIKAPIISSITDHFDDGSDKSDEKLREIVKYVDGTLTTKPTGVSDKDIALVEEARKIAYVTGGIDHQAFIPCYSDNVDLAKRFLKFIYSDKGLNVYYDTMNGLKLPATPTGGYQEKTNLTVFTKSVTDLLSENYLCTVSAKSKMFTLAQVSTVYRNGITSFVHKAIDLYRDGKNVEQITQSIMEINQNYIKDNWTTIKTNI